MVLGVGKGMGVLWIGPGWGVIILTLALTAPIEAAKTKLRRRLLLGWRKRWLFLTDQLEDLKSNIFL